MNTNTVKQAERLKNLGVESPFGFFEDENEKLICSNEWALRREYPEYQGPALTLDDLHRVFLTTMEVLPSLVHREIRKVVEDDEFKELWYIVEKWGVYTKPFKFNTFYRTENHAADWTEILIWLLENNHVTALQVNEALK